MSKLTQLLLSAAVLVALILLAYEMLLGQAEHRVMPAQMGTAALCGDGCSAWASPTKLYPQEGLKPSARYEYTRWHSCLSAIVAQAPLSISLSLNMLMCNKKWSE